MLLYGTAEVARIVGCCRKYVQRLAREHQIGQKKGNVWLFNPRELERLARKARPRGHPPKYKRKI